eukprot:174301-Amphidinium_carterae.2
MRTPKRMPSVAVKLNPRLRSASPAGGQSASELLPPAARLSESSQARALGQSWVSCLQPEAAWPSSYVGPCAL